MMHLVYVTVHTLLIVPIVWLLEGPPSGVGIVFAVETRVYAIYRSVCPGKVVPVESLPPDQGPLRGC